MLQFITHTNPTYPSPSAGAGLALKGGCRWIQLRMKDAPVAHILAEGKRLRQLCSDYGARLIIDDHVELVEAIGADGVHLGKSDMPVAEARKILGGKAIIGATANTFDDIAAAATAGADYIGLGPFRFTTTKQKLSPTLGIEGYTMIMQRCRHEGITLPVVAIGGITAADIAPLMAAGITGIAISGAILNASDPIEETKRLIEKIKA